jgi:CO/xanthine dehydrogenase FAD-binding subunit
MSCIIETCRLFNFLYYFQLNNGMKSMIEHYSRPKTIQEALELLSVPGATPLAGGTFVNTPEISRMLRLNHYNSPIKIVDLQELGLNHIRKHGDYLEIEASVTLQQLYENQHTPEGLKHAIRQEAPLNIRNIATIAGTLIACDGRSSFATVLLAADAKLMIQPGDTESFLGNLLPLRNDLLRGKLITRITIPLNVQINFDYVARSPSDRPIVCSSVARWGSGRTRLALGGYGVAPLLAMDGTAEDDIQSAARNGYTEAGDEWASAEYRADVAAVLAKRCLPD